MRDVDLISLRIFLAIMEEGSIARAAARENLVASAVSRRLAELEDIFQLPLVERGHAGITLTPAGEAFANHARTVQQATDRLRIEMSDYLRGIRGYLRVRISASALSAGLPEKLQQFIAKNESIRLDLEEMMTPDVFREVSEGRADIGVAPNLMHLDGLQLFPYCRYELAVVLPSEHPLAGRDSLKYDEVLQYDQVELQTRTALSLLLKSAAQQLPLPKRTRIRVYGLEEVCRMVSLGMGVGIIPLLPHLSLNKHPGLKMVPLDETWAQSQICIVARDIDTLPSPARKLLDFLQNSRCDKPSSQRRSE